MGGKKVQWVAAWFVTFCVAFLVLPPLLPSHPPLAGPSQSYYFMFPTISRVGTPCNCSSVQSTPAPSTPPKECPPPISTTINPAPSTPAETEPSPPTCSELSHSENQWFRHCTPPTKFDEARLEAYVQKRVSEYTGSCPREAQKFHCLEYAGRNKGWCDWSKAIEYQPISASQLVTPEACKRVEERLSQGEEASGALFFYPVYKELALLKRQIEALEHPEHAFLLQLDEAPFANQTLVSELQQWASTRSDVCVAQYGRVLYTSANQILIAFPAMAWAEQNLKRMGHFVVMGAQTYPVVSTQKLRETLESQRDKNIFSQSSLRVNETLDETSKERLVQANLESCVMSDSSGWGGHNMPEDHGYLNDWVDDFGVRHDSRERFNWLDVQLDRPWYPAFSGGVEVAMLTRELVAFLLHDPNGKMFVQYFTYTPVACELLVPSVTATFFPESISQNQACFMTWEDDGYENILLTEKHWDTFADGGNTLFARKFTLPGSEEILARIDKELRGV